MRLAHFTDIHITADGAQFRWRDLFTKRVVGWSNLALGRGAVFREATAIVAAFVDDLLAQDVDHVVFTGDFTGLSLRSEFEAARHVLRPLLESSLPVTALPGNHDVYVRSAVRERLFEEFFGEWAKSDANESASSLASAPYPVLRHLNEDAVLVALRDARPALWYDSSGRIGPDQLEACEALLRSDPVAGKTKVLALHYGLRLADGTPDSRLHGLRDSESVLQLADAYDVALILHGHLHHGFVHEAGAVATAAVANPGSLTHSQYAREYFIYSLGGANIGLTARRYDPERQEFEASDSSAHPETLR